MSLKEFSAWLGALIAPYDPVLKVISYIVGPTFAILAFIWNRRDRRELIAQGQELGERKEEIRVARNALEESRNEVGRAQADLVRKGAEVDKLERDLRSITEGSQELWKLRPPKVPPEYLKWIRDPVGAKLITVGNLKGGVGKTTLAANLAAVHQPDAEQTGAAR